MSFQQRFHVRLVYQVALSYKLGDSIQETTYKLGDSIQEADPTRKKKNQEHIYNLVNIYDGEFLQK